MTGGDNGEMTNPPTPTPPANRTLPSAPDFNAISSLTSAQRLPALTATQNTENDSITQSTEAQDSVSAVTDNEGNLRFHVVNEERESVIVDNSNANWAANPPPLSTFSYIFDKDSGARKTLANYNDGDFYAVTGFWYRSPTDFGVFADGSPIDLNTNPLPTAGSATYRGNVGGYLWGTSSSITSRRITGDIELQASFSGGNMMMGGTANILTGVTSPQLTLHNITDGDGVFTGGSITCENCGNPNTDSSWGGRFVGNPVTNAADDANSNEWPAGFVGAFSVHELEGISIDIIGFFGAIHEDLCAATGTGNDVFCTK